MQRGHRASSSEPDPIHLLDKLGVQSLQPLTGTTPTASRRRLGEVILQRISANGFSKPRGSVRNPDSVYWTSLVSGRLVVSGRGQTAVLTPRLSTFRRGIGLSQVVADQNTDILSIEIPRERLLDRGLDVESVLLPADELSRHTQGFLLVLLGGIEKCAPAIDVCLENAAVEMAAAVLMRGQGFRTDSASVFGALRLRAEAVVQRECGNPAVNPQIIADRLHVSLRTLQRAYAEAGETVADRLSHYRMQRAERLFAAGTQLSVDQVAVRSGFRSAYSLRSTLQRRHGMNIRDFRRHLQDAASGEVQAL